MQDSDAAKLDVLQAYSASLVNEAFSSVEALHFAMKARDFDAMALIAEDAVRAIHEAVMTQAELVSLCANRPGPETGYLLELARVYCEVSALAAGVTTLAYPGGDRVPPPRTLH